LQSVQNTISKWEETETNGEGESSVALIHMEEAQGLEKPKFVGEFSGLLLGGRNCKVPRLGALFLQIRAV
jgi:hypothetical protein